MIVAPTFGIVLPLFFNDAVVRGMQPTHSLGACLPQVYCVLSLIVLLTQCALESSGIWEVQFLLMRFCYDMAHIMIHICFSIGVPRVSEDFIALRRTRFLDCSC